MKIKVFVSMVAAGLLAANSVNAAEVGASIELGSTGIGVHLSTPIAANLNARFGLNYAPYSYTGNTSDVDYDFKLKLATVDALLDYHPMNGAFRVSGGVTYNGNSIDAHAKPNSNGTYTINGRTYSADAAGHINGKIDFRKAAPYLGIGWGNSVKNAGWGFAADLGVTFQGSPNTELTTSGCTAPALACAQLSRDVAAENAKLKDEVRDFKLYPVVRVGVSYRF
jgi:opacity protein-like surface antigen